MTHIDANTYGSPQVGLSQTQIDQFAKGVGDLGRGLYRDYNPTGPLPVNLSYLWNGSQMSAFKGQWNSESQLCYGAEWFSIDLPLMQSFRYEADPVLYPPSQKAEQIFSVLIGQNDGQTAVGARNQIVDSGANAFGSMTPTRVSGIDVGQIYFGTTNLLIKTGVDGANATLPDPNALLFEVYFVETNETGVVAWNGDNYAAEFASQFPLSEANWRIGVGQTRMISMRPLVQPYQRYVAHFTAPYQATLIAPDHWRVNLSLEVDPSITLRGLEPDA